VRGLFIPFAAPWRASSAPAAVAASSALVATAAAPAAGLLLVDDRVLARCPGCAMSVVSSTGQANNDTISVM
jgi:hypothetical protein